MFFTTSRTHGNIALVCPITSRFFAKKTIFFRETPVFFWLNLYFYNFCLHDFPLSADTAAPIVLLSKLYQKKNGIYRHKNPKTGQNRLLRNAKKCTSKQQCNYRIKPYYHINLQLSADTAARSGPGLSGSGPRSPPA